MNIFSILFVFCRRFNCNFVFLPSLGGFFAEKFGSPVLDFMDLRKQSLHSAADTSSRKRGTTMSKILHSISESHTQYTDKDKQRLGRGLLKPDTKEVFKTPAELPGYVSNECRLVLRQTISVLDKILQKSLTLRGMSSDQYVHRVLLGEALWNLLKGKFSDDGADKEALIELRRKWNAKVHPYDKYGVEPLNPRLDKNYLEIQNREEEDGKPPLSEKLGKWGKEHALWPKAGKPIDHTEIASNIFNHLTVQEVTIHEGKPRLVKRGRPVSPRPTQNGLMLARGLTASHSTSDPRQPSNKRIKTWEDNSLRKKEKQEGSEDIRPDAELHYFRNGDVAKTIFDGVLDIQGRNERVYNAWFGDKTFEHFRAIDGLPEEQKARQKVWNLHNAVRSYYKRLATSEKFRRALREAEQNREYETSEAYRSAREKLQSLLPNDKDQLLHRLTASNENASMSEAIRLGKLLVHAASMAKFDSIGGRSFADQISYLATSAGQSEIKRVEIFARIWRQSVAVTGRTLTGLTNYKKRDVTSVNESREAAAGDIEHMRGQLPIIFGSKDMSFDGGENRAAIFLDGDDDVQRDRVWALIRLGAGIRNAVQHFNVRSRLLDTLKNGVVLAQENPGPISNRKSSNQTQMWVSKGSVAAMENLLGFDIKMRKEATRLQLEALNAHEFLNEEELKAIVKEMGGVADFKTIAPPRFTAVISRVQALDENDDTVVHSDLDTLLTVQKQTPQVTSTADNTCRKGLLQMLYQSGFSAWFADRALNEELFTDVITLVIDQKNDRAEAFQRIVRKKNIPIPSEMADNLGLHEHQTFQSLFKALAEQAIRETDQDIRYRPDRAVQSETANRIELFRQEVFAHLFCRYLKDKEFGFIADICDQQPTVLSFLDNAMASFSDPSFEKTKPWHAQFYTWLYLVPPNELSKLRHQMRKSAVLEVKSPTETDLEAIDMLRQMDRLMGLYLQVEAAGFGDNEHIKALENNDYLYESPEHFGTVYSPDNKDHLQSFPGTRRGLRQIVRYGDMATLEPYFRKHPITDAEVATFTTVTSAETKKLFEDHQQLRKDILAASLSDRSSRDKKVANQVAALPSNVALYKESALAVATHNFHSNAARLTDHVRLHRVLMSVVAKFTDYALMWERDLAFAYFGMLYRSMGYSGFEVAERAEKENGRTITRIGFVIDVSKTKGQRQKPDKGEHFIPLIEDDRGFLAPQFDANSGLLPRHDRALFRNAFIEVARQNPADTRADAIAVSKGEMARGKPGQRGKNRKQKETIRNELAHLEVIRNGAGINLTYLMNAVRSLMSYDQKQKNAVVKSVKRILAEEGLTIEWRMKEDRLSKPIVYPFAEQHLKMLRRKDAPSEPILLPKASVRLTSMVQAIFDFGKSGIAVDQPEKNPETTILLYPQA
ncbi:MAG: type VI-A CRISPR-associated RNA-guided ribonuclease Cas13a [Paracoccaceae bacterium]